MPARRLLDPREVARLAGLGLRAHTVVEGFLTGLHQSPYHGFSVEFSQHRPYRPGDSLRHLDYRVLARTGKYFIKQYREETNLKAYLLFDHSASMGYGSLTYTKLDYGANLAAAMALLLLRQRDAVGLVMFSREVEEVLSARSAMGWLKTLTAKLESQSASGTTRVAAALLDTAGRVRRRGLVVVISDLMDEADAVLAGLRALRHQGHEVLVFHILDPMEVSFAFSRDARFRDMETGRVIPSRPWHIRDDYRHQVRAWLEAYRTGCSDHRIDYHLFTTDTPYEVALFQFLARRRRLM